MSRKLKKFIEVRGDIIAEEPGQLEQLSKQNSHKISLATQYEDKLSEMDLDDLQSLASELNLALTDNRDSLIKAIRKEFKKK